MIYTVQSEYDRTRWTKQTLFFSSEEVMRPNVWTNPLEDRQFFIGGSDARIIMGSDEAALVRLWREKRGEMGPEDLSGNLLVQLGLVTEPLNRHWYERNTGQTVECVQHRLRHPVLRWMGATLDGIIAGS